METSTVLAANEDDFQAMKYAGTPALILCAANGDLIIMSDLLKTFPIKLTQSGNMFRALLYRIQKNYLLYTMLVG